VPHPVPGVAVLSAARSRHAADCLLFGFPAPAQEAWREYQDEVNLHKTEKQAIKIQALARGRGARVNADHIKLQREKATFIQAHVRAWLARKRLQEQKRLYEISMLFASAERRAVMKLELAFIKKRERQRGFAAHIVQSHFHGRKVRKQAQEELTKRKLMYLMAKGETKAALRIQWWWFRFKATMADKREVEEAKDVRNLADEQEQRRRLQEEEEAAELAKPVMKKQRRSLGTKFLERTMRIEDGRLYYWGPDDTKHADPRKHKKHREVILACVEKLRVEEDLEKDHTESLHGRANARPHLIVLEVRKAREAKDAKNGKFTLRFASPRAHELWLERLRRSCPHATFEPLSRS